MTVASQHIAELGSITVLAGTDKSDAPEAVDRLDVRAGSVVAVVGPTGSGKSELLTDIELLADRDTVTGRLLLLDGAVPECGVAPAGLVARLSQNTNFIMNGSVDLFVRLHAESRGRAGDEMVARVLGAANELCGESICASTQLHLLSGGQARALMIADLAVVSEASVVLVDEVENAGIDKFGALEMLARSGKLVVVSTHHPVLMLMSDARVVMANGGMTRLLRTTEAERRQLRELRTMDDRLTELRDRLRSGESL